MPKPRTIWWIKFVDGDGIGKSFRLPRRRMSAVLNTVQKLIRKRPRKNHNKSIFIWSETS